MTDLAAPTVNGAALLVNSAMTQTVDGGITAAAQTTNTQTSTDTQHNGNTNHAHDNKRPSDILITADVVHPPEPTITSPPPSITDQSDVQPTDNFIKHQTNNSTTDAHTTKAETAAPTAALSAPAASATDQPSDDAVIEQIRAILQSADLATTTAKQIRKQLESHFNTDLSERKTFLNDQIMIAFADAQDNDDMGEGDDEDGDLSISQEEQDRLMAEELAAEMNSGRRPRREAAVESDRRAAKSRQFQAKMDQLKAKRLKRKQEGLPDDRPNKRPGKPVWVSAAVREICGDGDLTRGDVVKQLWEYIKSNNLQNPNKRSEIVCDDKLTAIFDRKSVTMFSMNKHLTKHVKNLDQ